MELFFVCLDATNARVRLYLPLVVDVNNTTGKLSNALLPTITLSTRSSGETRDFRRPRVDERPGMTNTMCVRQR